MNKELKKEILMWLLENENQWQRVNACHNVFRQYIYNSDGSYLIIGGRNVSDFIREADKLIYGILWN